MVAVRTTEAPKPALEYEPITAGTAPMEMPLTVRSGSATVGGQKVAVEELDEYGLLVFRRLQSGAAVEVWDSLTSEWAAAPGSDVPDVPGQKLAPDGEGWKALVVAAGGKDSAGKHQFAKAVSGYPIYHFRTVFMAKAALRGMSPASDNVSFASNSDKQLMFIGPGDGEEVDEATIARMGLKAPNLQTIGQVTIERSGSSARVTLTNASGATVVIHPDGRIELTPAGGQRVIVDGDMETERITYRPAGGGGKLTL